MALCSGNKQTPVMLRIALVGKTGSGKSSTGNTILGRKEFEAKADGKSVTKKCHKAMADVDGRRVAVVDTPGLFDTSLTNEVVIIETYKSISLLAPGPHAFLLLIQIGRFTEEEKRAVEYIKAAFGDRAQTYIMVVFTRGDDLEFEEKTIVEYIENTDPALKELISDCGNRLHVFNNRKKDHSQVKELLKKIDHMVKENGGRYYTSDMLREAEEAIEKEKERLLKEKEEEMRREEEKIRRKYQQEMEEMLQKERKKQEEEKRQMEEKLRATDERLKKEQDLREKEKGEMERERREWSEREQREREREQMEWESKQREWERQQGEREEEKREMERKRRMMEEEERERMREQRERELRAELERKCAEEIERAKRAFEEEARRQAERKNSFLDGVVGFFTSVGGAVLEIGSAIGHVITGVSKVWSWLKK